MKTSLGLMDGNQWEEYCYKLLSIRYPGNYQKVPARFGGDYGIEGFVTRSGVVFQCYCPDEDPSGIYLYELQRDKITRDINRLKKNAASIAELGTGEIREWRFLTPNYNNKELLNHCRKKETEVLGENIGSIHPDFTITLQIEDDFIPERAIYLGTGDDRLQPVDNEMSERIDELLESQNEIVTNIQIKLLKLKLPEEDHRALVEEMVRGYVVGQDELETLNNKLPDAYQNILKLKQAMEHQLRMRMLGVTRDGEVLVRTYFHEIHIT